MERQTIVLRGKLRIPVEILNDRCAEVVCRGDFRLGCHVFINIPVLRIMIMDMRDREDPQNMRLGEILVYDDFTRWLPYLKPIRSFRQFIAKELERVYERTEEFVVEGVRQYVRELASFDNRKAILRQVRNVISQVKSDDLAKIRRILEAVGVFPQIDNLFGIEI